METPRFELVRNLPGDQEQELKALRQVFLHAEIEVERIHKADKLDDGLVRLVAFPGAFDRRYTEHPGALRFYLPKSGRGTYTLMDRITHEQMKDLRDGTLESETPAKRRAMPLEGFHLSGLQQFIASHIDYTSGHSTFWVEEWRKSPQANSERVIGQHLRIVLREPFDHGNFSVGGLYFEPVVRGGRPGQSYEVAKSKNNHGNFGWLRRIPGN